ncbi:MAG: hypothetical protein HY721_04215 [Planctomycetes bacterium]|nr:hypothetical protein [Planctomycetota bacterium]
MPTKLLFATLSFVLWAAPGCAPRPPVASGPGGPPGPLPAVLLMAHGGDEAWNRAVEEAVRPLREEMLVEVAFGMADAAAIEGAVRRLEERGAGEICVLRLFVSGDSFRERTEQILGLRPGAPERPVHPPPGGGEREEGHAHGARPHGAHAHGAHGAHADAFWRLEARASFRVTEGGLLDSSAVGPILRERALSLSRDPPRELVLILAHGPGDDGENARWLERMDRQAETVRRAAPFREVRVETLREDWPEARRESEARIRGFVERASSAGGKTIVIPYRVHGFGPYAEVLKGLEYGADGRGFLPHPAVTDWLREQVDACRGAVATAFRSRAPSS